jgi:hypothetical protein
MNGREEGEKESPLRLVHHPAFLPPLPLNSYSKFGRNSSLDTSPNKSSN